MKNIKSIIVKISIILILSLASSAVAILVVMMPDIRKEVTDVTHDYMTDLAKYTAYRLEDLYETSSSIDTYKEVFQDVKVSSNSTSYIYVIDFDGMMVYHPEQNKIGKKVENDAAKELVTNLKSDKNISYNDIIDYEYHGEEKYAGYFISEATKKIIIVTADKKDILEPTVVIRANAIKSSIVNCLICIAISNTLVFIFMKPVKIITAEINEISKLDLTENTDLNKVIKHGDEFAEIALSTIDLRTNLRRVLKDIQEQSANLKNETTNLKEHSTITLDTLKQVDMAINDIAQSTNKQAIETSEANDEVHTMGDTITDTGVEATLLNDRAEEMKKSNESAIEVIKNLNINNERTRDSIDNIKNQIHKTYKSAADIQQAVDIISDIANKTNLLSLNASIEAARAGDVGRGFAVVANEIKQLADQSKKSALHISSIVDTLNKDSEETITVMNNVQEAIETQSNDVKSANDAFKILAEDINLSIENINNITIMADTLDSGRLNLINIARDLSSLAEENAASTEETSASSKEVEAMVGLIYESSNRVDDVAKSLDDAIGQFKI